MNYPQIDAVALALGPVSVRWYGLMYVLGFVAFYLLGKWRTKHGSLLARGAPSRTPAEGSSMRGACPSRTPESSHATGAWTPQQIADLLFYGVVGVVVGGRVGYVFFYGLEQFLNDPLWLVRVWEGGMSFHGGLLGVVGAAWLFARRAKRSFLEVADLAAPLAPVGLGLGRIGNFINAELPGRVTESPLGVHFPCHSVRDFNLACFGEFESVARHVSSLYQAAAEGVVLFALVWLFAAKPRALGRVSGMFLLGYGALRFATEFFRQPDPGKGFVAFDWMTMGQALSLPMAAFGLYLLFRRVSPAPPSAP